jgi:hypothetical protein
MSSDVLKLGPRTTVLPVIHGSGDFAIEVRRVMLGEKFDCLAVPLPPSFQEDVETAITFLPRVTIVAQEEPRSFGSQPWSPDRDDDDEDDEPREGRAIGYVSVDPCQPVIAALRIALGERMPRAFVDLETERFLELGAVLPDPYALKKTSLEKFAAAVLPAIPRLPEGQPRNRVVHMAQRIRELETRFSRILFVCSVSDWPWIKEAYTDAVEPTEPDDVVEETEIFAIDPDTLAFTLGELPFVTGLYERARAELEDDENLSIDGLKELLLTTRERYEEELGKRARTITPKDMSTYFRYVRNLALIERRMTPDLYTLVVAAQQIMGDQFAVVLAKTARDYAYVDFLPYDTFGMGIGRGRLPDGDVVATRNRLPGHPVTWRTCKLNPLPPKIQQSEWRSRWNPFSQCSWPPEDDSIEKFRTHVTDAAISIMGTDLAKTEKFSTSLKDGLDIRETLRNWHTGDLFVKVFPPTKGNLDCVLMFFDTPADPRDYPWRTTWFAEHQNESTLAFYATDFKDEIVGPGIGMATYGGAMFLFPPRHIPGVWEDRELDFTDTLEERLLAAACLHSEYRHIAVLAPAAPGPGFRRLAKKYGKQLVHVPLSRFSRSTIQQLRMFHVLNGHQIRSFASHFIRKA